MGLKIQHISGEIRSASKKAVILMADERSLFGIPELKEFEIIDGKVEWVLKSQDKKTEVKKVVLPWNSFFPLSINKLTSGSYSYHLQAHYVDVKKNKRSTDSICISSYCPPKILSLTPSVTGEITPGDKLTYEFCLEGLNYDNLELEVYTESKGSQKKKCSVKERCVEGKVKFSIKESETAKWKPKPNETELRILMKLLDKSNENYLSYEQ